LNISDAISAQMSLPGCRFQMEVASLDMTISERNLWSAVLLQLLKEVEAIRSGIVKCKKVMDNPDNNSLMRKNAFDGYSILMLKKKSHQAFLTTEWFEIICDFASHDVKSVARKVMMILNNRDSINEKQVKRGFTRKKK